MAMGAKSTRSPSCLVASGDGPGAAELARTHIANSLTASVTGALEESENVRPVTLEKTA